MSPTYQPVSKSSFRTVNDDSHLQINYHGFLVNGDWDKHLARVRGGIAKSLRLTVADNAPPPPCPTHFIPYLTAPHGTSSCCTSAANMAAGRGRGDARWRAHPMANMAANGDVTKKAGCPADVAIGGVFRHRTDLGGTQISAGSQELQPAVHTSLLLP